MNNFKKVLQEHYNKFFILIKDKSIMTSVWILYILLYFTLRFIILSINYTSIPILILTFALCVVSILTVIKFYISKKISNMKYFIILVIIMIIVILFLTFIDMGIINIGMGIICIINILIDECKEDYVYKSISIFFDYLKKRKSGVAKKENKKSKKSKKNKKSKKIKKNKKKSKKNKKKRKRKKKNKKKRKINKGCYIIFT